MARPAAGKGPLGENLVGQYYKAFPGHAAELEAALKPEILEGWSKLVRRVYGENAPLPEPLLEGTRGQWIRMAWKLLEGNSTQ